MPSQAIFEWVINKNDIDELATKPTVGLMLRGWGERALYLVNAIAEMAYKMLARCNKIIQ